MAKEAATNGEATFVPVTKSFIVKQSYSKVMLEWNKCWNKDGKRSNLYSWIRSINLIPDHFPTNFYSSQALTGHGRFPKCETPDAANAERRYT